MQYSVQWGDSPAIIARKFGVAMNSLIAANPQKPTTTVAGVRTWQSLRPGETLSVPVAGMVGDPVMDAVTALAAGGSPCDAQNAALVCAVQRALGVAADGKWGSDTAAAAQRVFFGAPAACSPRPSWWAPAGQTNCTAAAPVIPTPILPPPILPPPPLPIPSLAVPAALQALAAIDPCSAANAAIVCAAQHALGVAADGKWGTDTSNAARRLVPNAPAGCSPRPTWWTPAGQSNCGGAAPPPLPIPTPVAPPSPAAPPALQALALINPCDASSALLVCAAQRALGVTADGKWGTDTSNAARRLVPSAPAGCSPRPAWWTPAGQSNCMGASPVIPPVIPTPVIPTPVVPPVIPTPVGPTPVMPPVVPIPVIPPVIPTPVTPVGPVPTPVGPVQPVVTPPSSTKEGGVSTGAVVAGAIGAVALVGVVAAATMSGKGGARGGGAHRAAPQKAARKPSRKKSKKRR